MNQYQLLSNYYAQHRDDLVNYIAMRIADAEQAEDMVQDLFLRLLSGQQLISPQTLPALTYTLARHQASDYFRRRRVRDEYEHFIRRGDDADLTDDSMESLFSARQVMERMEHTLARLPEPCRYIYRLHIYDGLRVSEIAKQLSLPYKQVENRLGQVRKIVRQQLRHCV